MLAHPARPRPPPAVGSPAFVVWTHRLLTLAVALVATSCVYVRVFRFGVPDLSTRAQFDAREVPRARHRIPLRDRRTEERFGLTADEARRYASFDDLLARSETRAFLAVRHDEVVYERYLGGASRATTLPAFSISKTYAALLVGTAVADGTLGPMEGSVVSYLPELAGRPGYDRVTLDALLRMTSGIDYREESVDGAAMYYTTDLRSRMFLYQVSREPGTRYEYGSVNVQLLWGALHERLGGRTVSDYFADAVWEKLGAEDPAEWSLDSRAHGVEKLFGGFGATARDHARLGLLFLHGGTFHAEPIVPRSWVEHSLAPNDVAGVVKTRDGDVRRGHYQWFLTLDGRCYFAKGYHGQYIFVVPDRDAVFVRFGEDYGGVDWLALFVRLADGMGPD
jgi:CubicO group peptidase (beta-lactamase class C family)